MPVEASVAMIFCPISPALPMPVTIVFPRQLKRQSAARQNPWSSRRATWAIVRLSVCMTSRAKLSCSKAVQRHAAVAGWLLMIRRP